MDDSTQGQSWWKRLSGGLKRTSASLGGAIAGLVTKRKLDAATLEDLEHELIRADLGPDFAERIVAALGQSRYEKGIAPEELQALLAGEIEKVLAPVAKPLEIERAALRHPGRRRQRLGQDHHHRQARRALPPRRQERDAGRRRHLPRRRHRPTENLGRAHRRHRDRARAGRRRGGACLRRRHHRQGAKRRCACWSTPPAACRIAPS